MTALHNVPSATCRATRELLEGMGSHVTSTGAHLSFPLFAAKLGSPTFPETYPPVVIGVFVCAVRSQGLVKRQELFTAMQRTDKYGIPLCCQERASVTFAN